MFHMDNQTPLLICKFLYPSFIIHMSGKITIDVEEICLHLPIKQGGNDRILPIFRKLTIDLHKLLS